MSSRLFALELYAGHAIVEDKEEITLLEATIAKVITNREIIFRIIACEDLKYVRYR